MGVTWAVSVRSALTHATPQGLPSRPLSCEQFTLAGGRTGPLGWPVVLGGQRPSPGSRGERCPWSSCQNSDHVCSSGTEGPWKHWLHVPDTYAVCLEGRISDFSPNVLSLRWKKMRWDSGREGTGPRPPDRSLAWLTPQ